MNGLCINKQKIKPKTKTKQIASHGKIVLKGERARKKRKKLRMLGKDFFQNFVLEKRNRLSSNKYF